MTSKPTGESPMFCLATTTDCAAPTALSSAATVSQAVGKTRMQGGLAFASSAVTTNTALGCSLYLDRCIRELHRTIPLTIFCCKWQKDVQAPDPNDTALANPPQRQLDILGTNWIGNGLKRVLSGNTTTAQYTKR
ncbi:hypothetical protein PSHT_03634 [Puccinia striiformis]|uniref:Uncharacterized protein n=1 Tax=Puccinia striiformis TaxID=27350 RepID=A0A2S4WEW5_9BASI|nr:hypothetical protein PSHT_03634 [Puccinia striiformis]